MRLRALTLIVLMVTWMVPASGYSCLTDSIGVPVHEHEHEPGAAAHSHSDVAHAHSSDEQSIAHTHTARDGSSPHHAQVTEATSGPVPGAVPDALPSCCESERNAEAVDAAVKNAELRPKSEAAALALVIATAAPDLLVATSAQLRKQQPPPLPYEKNRRPLLI